MNKVLDILKVGKLSKTLNSTQLEMFEEDIE